MNQDPKPPPRVVTYTVEEALRRIEGICALVACATIDPELTTPALEGARLLLFEASELSSHVRDGLRDVGVLNSSVNALIKW